MKILSQEFGSMELEFKEEDRAEIVSAFVEKMVGLLEDGRNPKEIEDEHVSLTMYDEDEGDRYYIDVFHSYLDIEWKTEILYESLVFLEGFYNDILDEN